MTQTQTCKTPACRQARCAHCSSPFPIAPEDEAFYAKLCVPAPTLCPPCREQRRLSWRNEHHLYKRTCDLCKKPIISIYKTQTPFPVYCSDCWWSDKWDPLNYAQEPDFTRPFFEQFATLVNEVPHLAIINRNSTNSEYTNLCEHNKNCYLLVESSDNEDCLYSYWIQNSQDLVDCSFCDKCTLCYDCDNCENCYNLDNSKNCKDCRDSSLLENCIGCSNCKSCTNLVQKENYYMNRRIRPNPNHSKQKNLKEEPKKYAQISKSENCTGDYITHSKNCHHCFHAQDAEECRYSCHVWRNSKYVMDCDTVGMDSELCYECINTAIKSYNDKFCNRCWTVSDSCYCIDCDNSQNLFGCISLNHRKYCILNRQYSREEYERLRALLIAHMRSTDEYGEFFPAELSPFEYEESAANLYFPYNDHHGKSNTPNL